MTPDKAINFLNEAAKYFERRDTHGEDMAYWSNVYNAKNCREIVELIKEFQSLLRTSHNMSNKG